ncbi:trypsin-like peptidase domain-containing protein [Roseococcus sp. DSY-14]|uniref:trypsin-like peptidase domain-containing protein n=1 Tax=Roseococcus sp. DSY-14 TaxID=3369650 RepID=UPI00387B96CE
MNSRRSILLLPLAGLGACAALPAEQAMGTPAAAVARHSAASVIASGVPAGAAVAVAPGLAVTNAHVVRAAARPLLLRDSSGVEVAPRAVREVPGTDLAFLDLPPGFLRPAATAERPPRVGEPLWAVGPEGLGRAVASGPVLRPSLHLPGYGRGFTARLGALMGFSGGPVVNAQGQVAGLTTALLGRPGAASAALMLGADLDGLARPGREVFVLALAQG